MTIIDRLAHNREKQEIFRKIMRRLSSTRSHYQVERKRQADIYFLWRFAGWSQTSIAKRYGITRGRVSFIIKEIEDRPKFSICHPRGSCLLSK